MMRVLSRLRLAHAALAALGLAALIGLLAPQPAAAKDKENIVVCTIDDLTGDFSIMATPKTYGYQLATKEPADAKLKPWYTYLEVRPNFPSDQQNFSVARLVIMKRDSQSPAIPAGMPREIFWVEPTKNTTKWDIQRVLRNVPNSVDRQEFAKPDVPRDWKVQNVSPTAPASPSGQPRVIRNQDR